MGILSRLPCPDSHLLAQGTDTKLPLNMQWEGSIVLLSAEKTLQLCSLGLQGFKATCFVHSAPASPCCPQTGHTFLFQKHITELPNSQFSVICNLQRKTAVWWDIIRLGFKVGWGLSWQSREKPRSSVGDRTACLLGYRSALGPSSCQPLNSFPIYKLPARLIPVLL